MIHPIEPFEALKLMKNQWKSPEQIKRIQNQKLRKLVKHSYEKVPYYRKLFDSLKLKPEDIHSTEDLKKIPLLSKKIIKSLPCEQFIAKGIDIKNCRTAVTSGSTGSPLRVYYSWQDARMIGIALVRNFLTFGVKPWYKIAVFSGFTDLPPERRIFDRVGMWRCWRISSHEKPKYWIEKLLKWNPQVIYSNFMTIKLLAEFVLEKGLRNIKPKIVISTAGVLDESSRQKISLAFGSKIFDYYASWEGGNIAWECPECSGYHINSDMVILEVLKDGHYLSSEKEGEVVITNLHSYAMPFIRYRQEDIVAPSEEKPICGRPFPLIKKIQGRLLDFIVLPSGKKLCPHPFLKLMSNLQGIKQWRIIQEDSNLLSVRIVPYKGHRELLSDTIRKELFKLVGSTLKINISFIEEIKFDPSEKIRQIISRVIKS
jgi:phenylacetate-CoA ligase